MFETIRSTVHGFLATNWATTPISYGGGVEFDSEDEGDWIRVAILDGGANQRSLGDVACYRWTGFININLFARPTNTGISAEARVRGYADTLTYLYLANKQQGSLLHRTPGLTYRGESDGYVVATLSIPFQYDEII